jgi:Ras-related protein Rab-7A
LGVAFYRGAEACILVYDITNQRSFENLEQWKQDFLIKANPKDQDNFPFFVFGNKVDRANERKVSIITNKGNLSNYPNHSFFFV